MRILRLPLTILVHAFRARQARPILQSGVRYIPNGGQLAASVWAGAVAGSLLFDFFEQNPTVIRGYSHAASGVPLTISVFQGQI